MLDSRSLWFLLLPFWRSRTHLSRLSWQLSSCLSVKALVAAVVISTGSFTALTAHGLSELLYRERDKHTTKATNLLFQPLQNVDASGETVWDYHANTSR